MSLSHIQKCAHCRKHLHRWLVWFGMFESQMKNHYNRKSVQSGADANISCTLLIVKYTDANFYVLQNHSLPSHSVSRNYHKSICKLLFFTGNDKL